MQKRAMKSQTTLLTLAAVLTLSACDSQKESRDPETGTVIGTRSAEAGTSTGPGGTTAGPGGQGSGPSKTTTTTVPQR